MKKRFAGIASALLAGAMCVSFAACGGTPSAEEIESEKINADEWASAMAYFEKDGSRFTVTFSYTMEITGLEQVDSDGTFLNGDLKMTSEGTFVKDVADQHFLFTRSTEGDERLKARMNSAFPIGLDAEIEYYLEPDGSGAFLYEKKDGEWSKTYDMGWSLLDPSSVFYTESVTYDECVFNEEQKGYICSEAGARTPDGSVISGRADLCFKFDSDGRLVALICTASGSTYTNRGPLGGVKLKAEYVIEYEKDKVTLPSVA